MEKLQFTAEQFENDVNEYDVLIVGFYTEENYLMIQLSLEFEEDEDAAMQTYHIERDDQSFGNYGGVEKIILRRDQVQVIPTEKGKKSLQCAEILVDFEMEDTQFLELKISLIKIFEEAFVVEDE